MKPQKAICAPSAVRPKRNLNGPSRRKIMDRLQLRRNGKEYMIADELGKWGVLQRMPEKYYAFLNRSEKSWEWIYPPSLSSQRKALLVLEGLLPHQ